MCYWKLLDLCCHITNPLHSACELKLPSYLQCTCANFSYVGAFNALVQRTEHFVQRVYSDLMVFTVPEDSWKKPPDVVCTLDRFQAADRICDLLRQLLFLVPRPHQVGKFLATITVHLTLLVAGDANPSRVREPDDRYHAALKEAIKRQGDRVRQLKKSANKSGYEEELSTLLALKGEEDAYGQEIQVLTFIPPVSYSGLLQLNFPSDECVLAHCVRLCGATDVNNAWLNLLGIIHGLLTSTSASNVLRVLMECPPDSHRNAAYWITELKSPAKKLRMGGKPDALKKQAKVVLDILCKLQDCLRTVLMGFFSSEEGSENTKSIS
jgi:hypothetical protein